MRAILRWTFSLLVAAAFCALLWLISGFDGQPIHRDLLQSQQK
jgi:hypothetical protein